MSDTHPNPVPAVSVVIPSYNQARYLAEAIDSALAQTWWDREIIVIDDGSDDDTLAVAQRYGDHIRYHTQCNQGLAGARNTGLGLSRGDYVAFLDADDIWQPEYLGVLMALARSEPKAVVYFACAQCMDEQGRALPQRAGISPGANVNMYQTLLRANFLIPSAVVIRKSTLLQAGLFDSDRSLNGCEDWDLWLRLALEVPFAGTRRCLVRYRLHPASLSADPSGMHRAAFAVVEKNFGLDDGKHDAWTADKRRAYGGLYRWVALTALVRLADWSECMANCRRALVTDPTLCDDLELFYELALGSQPLGLRGTPESLGLAGNAAEIEQLLAHIFTVPVPGSLQRVRQATYSTAYIALARVARLAGQRAASRTFLLRAIRSRPRLAVDISWWRSLTRSLVPYHWVPKRFNTSPMVY